MKKITWCAVARAPYLDFLHTEVNKHFALRVFYKLKKRTHPWDLDKVIYDNSYIDDNFWKAFKSAKTSDLVIISGWSFWQHLVIMLLPMRNTKKVYWTDTPNLDKTKWDGVKGYIRRLIVKIVFTVCDEVWSTGVPGCAALVNLGCKKEKIRSFPFFFDLSRYNNLDVDKQMKANAFKKKHCNNDTEIIFFSAGQVIRKKRFDDAIKAIGRLKNKKVVLWIGGTGPQEEELKFLAQKMGVAEQVKFLGWLQQDEIELAFITSDVFLHPSYFDPFPVVVLDAMTWGKPIIATEESGSAKDRVVNGASGFLYPSGQVDKLINNMQFFIENKEAIKMFGIEARKTACSYPIEAAIKQLNSVI